MRNTDLSIDFLGARLLSPVFPAAGTFGLGSLEVEGFDFTCLGAVVTKTVTCEPIAGNKGLRLYEVSHGLINCIGLENPGIEVFMREKLPLWLRIGVPVIVNISGHSISEFIRLVQLLNRSGIFAIEVNLSCPNVKDGLVFSTDPDLTFELVKRLVAVANLSLIIKLTPNVDNIGLIAQAAEAAGANAISAVNTFKKTVTDPATGKVIITGGLSGPVIMPRALKKVREICQAVTIPVIGMGGISSGEDAIKFLLAGATVVAVGTESLKDPLAIQRIVGEMRDWLREEGLSSIRDIKGQK